MGGPGSGNRDRYGTRDTTAAHRSIDVRRLARGGHLTPGRFTLYWSDGGSLTVEARDLAAALPTLAGDPRALMLVLDCRYRRNGGPWEDVRQSVFLDTTPCHYGGARVWFRCPAVGCDRRVAILYGAGRHFACRRCYDLAYPSTRENAEDRVVAKLVALRRRLGGSAALMEPLPDKPPRMHARTYLRLLRQGEQLDRLHHLHFLAKLARYHAFLSRYERPAPPGDASDAGR